MREGDLADMVLPLVSVDEYVSKVSKDEAAVFGFYVHDQEAAADFNRFLQKSAVPILDTEVSPAPDQHGFYMVFVEMLKNERIAQNLSDILSEIKPLVDIDEWEMRVRNRDSLVTFSEKTLTRALANGRQHKEASEVLEFLYPSALVSAAVEGNLLILEGSAERYVFEIAGLEPATTILESLTESVSLTMRAVARTNRITHMLGENWLAVTMGPYMLLQRIDDPRALLLWD